MRRTTARAALCLALPVALLACGTLSVREEEELGAEAARELRKQLDFVGDPYVVEYVEAIGAAVVAASGPQPYAFRFHVVEDDSLNAFALPAGGIYIHTGTILAAADVGELAGVIGHEVGHVVRRHVARNYARQRNTGILYQLASLAAAIFVGGSAAAGGQIVGELAAVAFVNTFTREAEEEADAFAVEVLPIAGYHPQGLVSFFETLQRQGGAHVPEFLASHPATENRIAHTAALIEAAELPEGLVVRDGGELQIIQRRIELLTRDRRE
jgi:predicted Zn-dependent protease